MTKKNIKDLISGAVNSASLKEASITSASEAKHAVKKKMILLPVELDERIKKVYKGTCSSYILMAIHDKLKKDES
jgi:hypothetical protein